MYATTRQAERLVFQLYPFHAHKTGALQRPAHGAFHPRAIVSHQTSGMVVMSARQFHPIQPLFTLVTSQRNVESVHIGRMNEWSKPQVTRLFIPVPAHAHSSWTWQLQSCSGQHGHIPLVDGIPASRTLHQLVLFHQSFQAIQMMPTFTIKRIAALVGFHALTAYSARKHTVAEVIPTLHNPYSADLTKEWRSSRSQSLKGS